MLFKVEKELSRRKFLQLLSASAGYLAIGGLAGSLEAKADGENTRIFLDVDSMAFFNAPAKNKAVDLGMLEQSIQMHWPIKQEVSYYLPPESRQYFKSGPGDEPVVVAVVSECILFCAYTKGNDGSIISSGAYHAKTLKPAKELRQGMEEFLANVKPRMASDKAVLKASGRYGREDQEEVIRSIEGVLRKQDIYLRKLVLKEETGSMINKFYPDTGRFTAEKVKF